MKIKIANLIAASLLLSAGLNVLQAQAQQPAPELAPRKAGKDEGPAKEGKRQRLLEKFDLNHDGTLDGPEREKMRAAREEKLKQMGMDGGRGGRDGRGGRRLGFDGAGGGSGGPGGPGGGPGGPGGGPGSPGGGPGGPGGIGVDGPRQGGMGRGMGGGMTDEQRQARRQRMLDRFDANHDGKLDDAERVHMREQMGKMGGGGRPHRRGGDWGGGAPGGGAPGGAGGGGAPGGPPGGGSPS